MAPPKGGAAASVAAAAALVQTDQDLVTFQVDAVLAPVRALRAALATAAAPGDGAEAPQLPEGCRQVDQIDGEELARRIEALTVTTLQSITDGQGFGYTVPSRAASNQLYVPALGRLVLQDATTRREWAHASSARRVTIMARVLELVYDLALRGIHVTKRDLFYTDVKLFVKQAESDACIEDVATVLGCTRHSLHVVASEKGIVVGRLRFRDAGDLIDCARMGVSGKSIPAAVDRLTDLESDAEFILLVEKDAAFARLAEDRFYQQYPCIIITARGQPDVATRALLRRLRLELGLPVLALVDADPYGLQILSTYLNGSKNMSFDSANLVTPDIRWLGVRPSDLERYQLPEQVLLDMTENDIKTGRRLLEEDFVRNNAGWTRELQRMLKTKKKAEIQSLNARGVQYLTRVFLPQKLQDGDWI